MRAPPSSLHSHVQHLELHGLLKERGLYQTLSADGYFVPIWRIDDGAVYGIPWEQCEGAARRSQEAVAKGFPPSWPGLTCANVSYSGPGSSYARVLPLAAGRHTLWTGLLAMVPRASMGWQEAWIEIISIIGPLFPTPPDT